MTIYTSGGKILTSNNKFLFTSDLDSLLDELISYWHLDVDTGDDNVTQPDAHGNNDLGANYVGSANGKLYNRNAYFRSDSFENLGRLRIVDNASLSVGGGTSFTFATWIKIDDKSRSMGLMGKDGDSGERDFGLIYSLTSDRIRWHIGDGNTTIQSINADQLGSPTAGEWYLVIGWYDADGPTIGIQINDGTPDTAAATITPADTINGFCIGRQGDFSTGSESSWADTAHFDGPAFWKRVLSSEEKTRLYNKGAGQMYPWGPISAPSLPTLANDEFTIVIIPDTQRYMANDTAELENTMNWIIAHAGDSDKNIQHVIHVGDVVLNGTATEFARADVEFDILDTSGTNYQITVGNHDYDGGVPDATRDTTEFNVVFPQSRFTGQTGWNGGFEDGTLSENNYWLKTIGGNDYIFITMEFAPRQAVLDWVDGLLTTHSSRDAIIVTHHWLTDEGERFIPSDTYSGDDVGTISGDNNDANEMWDELIKLHDNIVFVTSGHWGRGYRQDAGNSGNIVTQTTYSHHGNGFIRLITIKPTKNTILAHTYSPTFDAWDRTPLGEFELTYK